MAAKKRKATSASTAQDDVPDTSSKRTRMRIKTYEDVAGSDDEFHLNRDKVMLDDGPEAKRRRKVQEEGIVFVILYRAWQEAAQKPERRQISKSEQTCG